jgi:hypothetical protein
LEFSSGLRDLCGLSDSLFDPVKYPESLEVLAVALKGPAVVNPEYQPLNAEIEFIVVTIVIFGEVVSANNLIQLQVS